MDKKIVGKSKNLLRALNKNLQLAIDKSDVTLGNLLDNPYAFVALRVFLVLYAAFAAPKLPRALALLMDSAVIRIIFAGLIVYTGLRDPLTALLIAIVFIVTLQTANRYKIYDSSLSVLEPGGISWLPSSKEGAVVGMELYDDPSKILNQRVLQKNEALERALNVEIDKANDLIDLEIARKAQHEVLKKVEPKYGKVALPRPRTLSNNPVFNATRSLGDNVISLSSNVGAGVLDGVANVGSGSLRATRNFSSGVINAYSELNDAVVPSVGNFNAGLAEGTRHLSGGVISGAKSLSDGVLDSASSIGYGLKGGVKHVKDGVVGGVNTLGDCLLDSAGQIGSGLVNGVRMVSNGVLSGAGHLTNGLVDGVSHANTGLVKSVNRVNQGIVGSANNFVNHSEAGVRALGQGAYSGVNSLGSGLVQGVRSVAQPVALASYELPNGLAEHLTNAPEPLVIENGTYVPVVDGNQFGYASENLVPGANSMSVYKMFENQHNTQGLYLNNVTGNPGRGSVPSHV